MSRQGAQKRPRRRGRRANGDRTMRFMKPTAAVRRSGDRRPCSSPASRRRADRHGTTTTTAVAKLAAGIIGFAAGAIIRRAVAAALARRLLLRARRRSMSAPPPVVYQPAYQPRYQAAPVYYAAPQPWTQAWFAVLRRRATARSTAAHGLFPRLSTGSITSATDRSDRASVEKAGLAPASLLLRCRAGPACAGCLFYDRQSSVSIPVEAMLQQCNSVIDFVSTCASQADEYNG